MKTLKTIIVVLAICAGICYSAYGFAYYTNTVKWGNTRITVEQAEDSLKMRSNIDSASAANTSHFLNEVDN